ncbi:unnamed protein product [Heligmosomoides polygyrus]|uniref:Uncharacterized protein n=1 Tax=Heligmosomoides polygyrus TaxID=6339 RepID=A0A3P7VCN3_HELPZ|nr:unnamed protein product [Heligmosomoides polygyrus]
MSLLASGKLDLSGITRAHYTLEQSAEAFERSQNGDVMKVFIHCERQPPASESVCLPS